VLKTAALAGTAAAVTGIPLTGYVAAPALTKGALAWIKVGRVEGIARGAVTMLTYKLMLKDGWLILPRQGVVWARSDADGNLTIFSSACTHLGCTVRWQEPTRSFECPCHSARFDADGRPVAGPPKKALTVLAHKVEDGELLVLLQA
jgi:quinol---cytochrome c reductase iron-sulfur subunit, bacillus type